MQNAEKMQKPFQQAVILWCSSFWGERRSNAGL